MHLVENDGRNSLWSSAHGASLLFRKITCWQCFDQRISGHVTDDACDFACEIVQVRSLLRFVQVLIFNLFLFFLIIDRNLNVAVIQDK